MTNSRIPRTRSGSGPRKSLTSSRAQHELMKHVVAAAECLETTDRERDHAIHAARKAIKRARALLRLMRGTIGEARFKRENQALRDAARPLTGLRDARVLLDTLEQIAWKSAVRATPGYVQMHAALHRSVTRSANVSERSLARSRHSLRTSVSRIRRWRLGRDGAQLQYASLRRAYKRARRACARATASRTVSELHEWRKQVKYLWHILQFLERPANAELRETSSHMHELSDQLGDHHDLCLLLKRVERARRSNKNRHSLKALEDLSRARATRLEHKALRLGHELFREPAKQWCREIAPA